MFIGHWKDAPMQTPLAAAHTRRLSYLLLPALVLLGASLDATASENYRGRQSPFAAFGGEITRSVDTPGVFANATLTRIDIDKVVDGSGKPITLLARSLPLPTLAVSGGALANGSYALNVAAGSIDFHQTQTQLNLLLGYLSADSYAQGRVLFAINLPFIRASRSFVAAQPLGTLTPTPAAALPAALRAAIGSLATAGNKQLQAAVAAQTASQNIDVSGLGDAELSLAWIARFERLRVAAGASLFVPSGQYDMTRGPNPGFGNFYTLRPSVALNYALNPDPASTAWDKNVSLATRLSYGINSSNKDSGYRSGNFLYLEGAVAKAIGNWAAGLNLSRVQQTSDDSGSGVGADGNRTRNNSIGPFLAHKIPGQDAAFNLQYSHNFDSRYALVGNALQMRYSRSW